MVGAARNNLGKHGRAVLGDTCVVVVEVMRGKISAGAELRGLGRCPMIQQVEGSVIVLYRVSWAGRSVAEGSHCRLDGIEEDVRMSVHTTQPSDEIPDVKIEEKEEECQAVRAWCSYISGHYADWPHGTDVGPTIL